jgi:GNAT superfamily N-acetyltransferase
MERHFDIARVVTSADARDWHSVVDASDPFDHPGLLADPIEEVLAWLPGGAPSERVEMYVARDMGRSVGAAKLKLPIADTAKVAHIRITVLPRERRRGIGRQLFEAIRARATEFGRETIDGLVGGPLDEEPPGSHFAAALGANEALAKVRYELILAELDGVRCTPLRRTPRPTHMDTDSSNGSTALLRGTWTTGQALRRE